MCVARSVPAILLDHVCQFNDELAFLVLLTVLVCMFLLERGSEAVRYINTAEIKVIKLKMQ